MKLTVEQIQQLMHAMAENGMNKCELSQEDFSLKLVRETASALSVPVSGSPSIVNAAVENIDEASQTTGNLVKSPIVGTFYAQKAPDEPPFVKVGDQVQAGDVLFIIESMKLMNEVTSEYDGVISEILVKNGEAVEYGQPLMRIE